MILTRDRRLLFFDSDRRGGIELAEGVPFGKCLWSGTSRDDHLCYALIHREAEPALYLFVINIALKHLTRLRLRPTRSIEGSGRA